MPIKKLQNNFTTPEQSKRLLELGVPRWSSDEYRDQKGYRHSLEGILDVELFFQNFPHYLPCWSVGRLIEVFDMCYQREPEECITEHWILTQEAIENFGSYIEYLVQTFNVQKNYLDFSKLEE